MPVALKRHLPYPVTPEWKEDVREELTKRGRGSAAKLCEHLGCSSSQLSELLAPESKISPFVEPIHTYFGWAPPMPPTASRDAGELVHGYLRMSASQREMLNDAYEVLKGSSGEHARKALAEMLKAFREKE